MSRCGHGASDAVLVALVEAAKQNGWDGAEGEVFSRVHLPELAAPLLNEFTNLKDDVLWQVWESAHALDLGRARSCPRAWIRNDARWKLRAQRFPRDRVEHPSDPSVLLAVPDPGVQVHPDRRDSSRDAPEVTLWADFRDMLEQLLWPAREAVDSVSELEEAALKALAEDGKFPSEDALAESLRSVPPGRKRPLLKFAFAPGGYVWARLHGVDHHTALQIPHLDEELRGLLWPSTAVTSPAKAGQAA